MRRREFITLLGGAAAWPLAARGQEAGRSYRLGVLFPSGRQTPPVVAFFNELRLNGFVEGQNLEVIPGGYEFRNEQVSDLAAAILKAAPDVIYSGGLAASRAVQAATRTVPVVAAAQDLVADKLVASLARPGGNITGISFLAHQLDGKRLELLIEAAPSVRQMAILADTATSAPQHLQLLQDAAGARGIALSVFPLSKPEEIGPAMNQAKSTGAGAINLLSSPLFNAYPTRRIVIERAAALQLPAMYEWPEIAEEGGFAAYGPRFSSIFHQLARQVARVLRGVKPADIPVEQPTHFELVINLKTAKSIGHEVPAGLVLRADKVIE
jgi:putative ABC transport system substrate-binding protein